MLQIVTRVQGTETLKNTHMHVREWLTKKIKPHTIEMTHLNTDWPGENMPPVPHADFEPRTFLMLGISTNTVPYCETAHSL